ncbi:MAG: N-acetyl sugar amidotransferase [Elusimicrobia bacterium]|nr:N-acetyl sugar amidotransferase [Elusimicrobiota bacterium]
MKSKADAESHPVIQKHKLPLNVVYCTRCVISNQRPRIEFDAEGVCNACRFAEMKKNAIDWNVREKELLKLLDEHRSKDGSWDVIVPASGGKDSTFTAHQLKHKYGMHPLSVTWAPHIYTEVGWRNLQNFIHKGGIDNILGTPNGKVHRELTRLAFEHLGDPFQPFIYGQKAFPMQIAAKYKIPLIMYGEDGEVEYGGDKKAIGRCGHDASGDLLNHYFSGIGPLYWTKHGIRAEDLHPYLPPTQEEAQKVGLKIRFLGYYKKWVPQENYYYAVENAGFCANPDGRSEGTYSKYASLDDRTDGFHYYLAFIKFGIGRATSDAAHEIRDGHIDREEAVRLVHRYDGEFPMKHYQEFLEYTGLTEKRFHEVIDSYRPPHLWEKTDKGWKLKHQVS